MTALEEYYERLAKMEAEGLEDFKVTWDEQFLATASTEQKAKALLDFMNAPSVDHVPGLFKENKRVQTF